MKPIANSGFLFLSLAGMVAFAADVHREHGVHVHGSATLAIAFDQAKGQIDFKTPAGSILGFEHAAQSEKDQKILANTKQKFEKDFAKMISFSSILNCQLKPIRAEQLAEAGHSHHSDFVAEYQVLCAKSPKGFQLNIDFSQFAALKDLDITVLMDDLQITAEAKGKAIQIELK